MGRARHLRRAPRIRGPPRTGASQSKTKAPTNHFPPGNRQKGENGVRKPSKKTKKVQKTKKHQEDEDVIKNMEILMLLELLKDYDLFEDPGETPKDSTKKN